MHTCQSQAHTGPSNKQEELGLRDDGGGAAHSSTSGEQAEGGQLWSPGGILTLLCPRTLLIVAQLRTKLLSPETGAASVKLALDTGPDVGVAPFAIKAPASVS